MRDLNTLLGAAVVALVMTALPASAQTGRIGGTVKDTNGQPIKGATVVAENPNSAPSSFTATTDDRGRYSMIGLKAGTWKVTACAPGFAASSGNVPMKTIGAPMPPVDFTLAPGASGPAGALAGVNTKELQGELAKADAMVAIDPAAGFVWGGGPFGFPSPAYDTRFLPPNPFITYATYRDPRSGLSFKPENEFEAWSTMARADWEITETFVRASGPGGQNVNKVATAVALRFEAERSPGLPPDAKARLRRLAGRRWTSDGAIVITAERHRSQALNRAEARDMLLHAFAGEVLDGLKIPELREQIEANFFATLARDMALRLDSGPRRPESRSGQAGRG